MRRTKIIATIGPSSGDERTLSALIAAGMDAARLNFSHGAHTDHERNFHRIRKLSARIGKPVGIIGDLQGPKIRIGDMADESLNLRKGGSLIITTSNIVGSGNRVSTTYKRLHRDVKVGDRILIDDGTIEVKVANIEGRDIYCRVVYGGKLSAHKGINLPGVDVSEPALTKQDKKNVEFAVKLGVDYLALSFVRRSNDVVRLKRFLKSLGSDIPVIAKIEKPEAVENVDDIISVSDGIMVARGDLGVEMPPEQVPHIQKDIIGRCMRVGKLVITATQMLDSMIRQPMPTRAETSDVANAIYDGSGAVMLSGESAVGDYPVQSVRMMARIAEEADASQLRDAARKDRRAASRFGTIDSFESAIGLAVEAAARHLPTRLIVCFTSSGFTALRVSAYRPDVPIIAATHNRDILPRMSLYWGVKPICVPRAKTIDSMIENVEQELLKRRLAKKGDGIIITAGYPLGVAGTTNMMQLVRIGEHGDVAPLGPNRRKRG